MSRADDDRVEFLGHRLSLKGAALSHVRGGADLQIMLGIGGEHDLTERELSHLSGRRGSRPVRIGNGAWNQRQIDVYGELIGAVYRLRDRLKHLDPATKEFLAAAADLAGQRWKDKGWPSPAPSSWPPNWAPRSATRSSSTAAMATSVGP